MISWIISGDPRTIQMMPRNSHESGLKRDMEPMQMRSPSGMAPSRVTANSRSVCRKP